MKKITTEDFENSFYYIGAGYDIEPLLRFTHITNLFIYATLYVSLPNVTTWYDEQFEAHTDIEVLEKKIYREFSEEKHYELHPEYIYHLSNNSFIHKKEIDDYYRAFSPALRKSQWALKYRLKRKSLNREIIFIFVTAEGIASYIALSHNGRYAPKILATIKTDVLEEPRGIMNRYLDNNDVKKPEIWVRGYMPELPVQQDLFGNDIVRTDKGALNKEGVFPNVGLSFNHKWICGEYEGYQTTRRRDCKGFITDARAKELSQLKFKRLYTTGTNQIQYGNIVPATSNISTNDIVVVPKSLSEKLNVQEFQIINWESVVPDQFDYDYKAQRYRFIPVSKQLDLLHKELKKRGVSVTESTIHIIPYCLEDEGVQYVKFLSSWDIKTITYVNSLYDFLDLKD